MSFNWRLLLAPAEILDYVVEHEVAHLAVHDHSERFWRCWRVAALTGASASSWLRRHGHALDSVAASAPAEVAHGQQQPRHGPERHHQRGLERVAAPAHDAGRQAVDHVLERQRLGHRLQHAREESDE